MDKPKQRPQLPAKKLRQIRINLGLSQNELIKKLGFEGEVIQSHISAYEAENHNRIPQIGVLLQYSRISGIRWKQLLMMI